jgi:hypothetical protein
MAPDPRPDFDHECFLISPIGPEDSDIRRRADGVRDYIVRHAAEELGLAPVRADDIAPAGPDHATGKGSCHDSLKEL